MYYGQLENREYFTNEEMKANGKGDIDVQSVVERPHVYILG